MPTWYTDPPLALAICFIAVGFFILIKGADLLVEGAVALARRAGIATAVIGATVVAFGTSLPELVVTIGSSLKDYLDDGMVSAEGPAAIAIGNIVGSNIFNMGAILGLSAIVRTLPVPRSTLRLDYPLMLGAFVLLIVFSIPFDGARHGVIVWWEGLILFLGVIGFTYLALRLGKIDPSEVEEIPGKGLGAAAASGLIALGILMLCAGGDMSLNGAIRIAKEMGISERVIGLTIMAIGTSLPELATSMQAARRGHTDIAVANVVGSNVFNVLAITGLTAMLLPLPVAHATLHWDYWWMMGINLALLPLFLFNHRIGRFKGLFLVSCLLVYLCLLLALPELGSG